MIHRVPHQTISLLLVGLLALVSTNPVHAQKGKKPPQDDPGPTLPSLQYSISLVPKDIRPMHANHSGMISKEQGKHLRRFMTKKIKKYDEVKG